MSNHINLHDIVNVAKYDAERVVEFTLAEDRKHLNAQECCDYYFDVDLSKPEVRKLIDRLEALYAQMEDL